MRLVETNAYRALVTPNGQWMWATTRDVSTLPTAGVPEGSLCFDENDKKFYAMTSGAWTALDYAGNVTGDVTGDVDGNLLGELRATDALPTLKWLEAEVDFSVTTEGAADTGLVLPVTGIYFGGMAVVTGDMVGDGGTVAKISVAPGWSQLPLYGPDGGDITVGAGCMLQPAGTTIDVYTNDNSFSGASVTVEPLDASNNGLTMTSGKIKVRLLVAELHTLGVSGGA